MVNGKAKGSGYERQICKHLSIWIQGTEKPYLFWRQPASGGLSTIDGRNSENLSGDIRSINTTSEWFCGIYSVEIKTGYPDASLDKFLKYNKSDPLRAFWVQCIDDANLSEKRPLLIYKKKGMPTPWVGIDENVKKILAKELKGLRFVMLHWAEDLPDTYLYEYKEFFDTITPELMKKRFNIK
jgi:hypothetical protein